MLAVKIWSAPAGLPYVVVRDPASDYKLLGQSAAVEKGTSDWKEYTFPFKTGDETQAVQITLLRQGCPAALCPIFGRVWLDDFSMGKLTPPQK